MDFQVSCAITRPWRLLNTETQKGMDSIQFVQLHQKLSHGNCVLNVTYVVHFSLQLLLETLFCSNKYWVSYIQDTRRNECWSSHKVVIKTVQSK
jgi:hypothetical protein